MNTLKAAILKFLVLGLVPLALAGCKTEDPVSFAADVKPILDRYCLECHQQGGAGFAASGLSMESYADLMKGTNYGPMVIAGDSLSSNLIFLMEWRADPSIRMPHGGSDKVTQIEIDVIRAWIDQGARDN